ncbi:hypothetical protein M2171_002598 [Bradyrhizobium japonicum USDA 38]|uniref:hypothetical protein n=1 Tax=Bradyrhizobium japonicum TaxID=375 RepID=UPI000411D0D4|nr:hypothetical protein [Bradyrhizobium japonicum]MCS3893465.1 hypothetical protein [Bradyrhizobium japonicum USDA 38]MCS3945979.1 hypothetical protein [Bradyrhizobium japonicum]
MSGDSHTNFNSGGFSVGAAAAALTMSGAMVASLQAAANLGTLRWANWERDQLETAISLSEELRRHACQEREELRVENAKLKAAMRRVTMRRAVAQ